MAEAELGNMQWRSAKYEKVYLNDFETVKKAYLGLKEFFEFYSHIRAYYNCYVSFSTVVGKNPTQY